MINGIILTSAKNTNSSDAEVLFLDLNLSINHSIVSAEINDKPEKFIGYFNLSYLVIKTC